MPALIIICGALLAALFLIIYGAVSRQSGILSTGTAILGALLGAAGVKYQPQIQQALCKFGLHKWGEPTKCGIWASKRCTVPGCPGAKQKRAV